MRHLKPLFPLAKVSSSLFSAVVRELLPLVVGFVNLGLDGYEQTSRRPCTRGSGRARLAVATTVTVGRTVPVGVTVRMPVAVRLRERRLGDCVSPRRGASGSGRGGIRQSASCDVRCGRVAYRSDGGAGGCVDGGLVEGQAGGHVHGGGVNSQTAKLCAPGVASAVAGRGDRGRSGGRVCARRVCWKTAWTRFC